MIKRILIIFIFCGWFVPGVGCQVQYEIKSVFYNALIGGISGGIGSMINKPKEADWLKALRKGFVTGSGGGALMYAGKKLNRLVSTQENVSWAWLSRGVFSAGNSVVENAASGLPWWARFHLDLAFVRLEYRTATRTFAPSLMASSFGAFLFASSHGHLDWRTSLKSSTATFHTATISYAPRLVGSTTGNQILLVDTLSHTLSFTEIYAHEMVHTFQFQTMSGFNYFFIPLKEQWASRLEWFRWADRFIYGDLNYELMLANYFLLQGGANKPSYCHNFLENEAEVLSVGRVSCPAQH